VHLVTSAELPGHRVEAKAYSLAEEVLEFVGHRHRGRHDLREMAFLGLIEMLGAVSVLLVG
jgi:hypothetical protein